MNVLSILTQLLNTNRERKDGVLFYHDKEGKLCLTYYGQQFNDLIATINEINSKLPLEDDTIIGSYTIENYRIIDPLTILIRPLAVKVGNLKVTDMPVDCLEKFVPFETIGSLSGRVLTPAGFDNAQLDLLKSLNPKVCKLPEHMTSVERRLEILDDEWVMYAPVRLTSGLKMVTHADTSRVKMFPLSSPFISINRYVVDVGEVVVDVMRELRMQLLALAKTCI